MAYSIDFRKRALAFMDEGHTFDELKEVFGIYPSTLCGWRKLRDETNSLEPRPNLGRPSMIDIEKLQRAVQEKPDAYLRELAVSQNCSISAIFKALKKHKITYKKVLHVL